jgi:hypothetical protein
MGSLHNSGKEELEKVREKHREKTEMLVATFAEVLQALQDNPQDVEVGRLVKETLSARGSIDALIEDCEAVASCHGNNYFPLILQFFRNHRSVLFRLVNDLRLDSTTEDRRVVEALEFVMENQNRRGEWLPDEVDLSFASEQWQRIIRVKKRVGGYEIARRHLEVCVFSYLATELKSGDVCVQDSDEFADYRKQLLSWEECQPLFTDYLNEMGFPNQDQDFVKHLQDWMNHMCRTVDQKYLDCGDVVVINELSIKAGKISSAMLLRKLGNYSRKNRLYKAFRELGRQSSSWNTSPIWNCASKLQQPPTKRKLIMDFQSGCFLEEKESLLITIRKNRKRLLSIMTWLQTQ